MCFTILDREYYFVCLTIQLKLLVRDTKGDPRYALEEVLKLSRTQTYVGIITGESSGPTMEMVKLLSIPMIDHAVISYIATSPYLSRPDYSNFVRTAPSDAVQAKMMAALMKGGLVGCMVSWPVTRVLAFSSQCCNMRIQTGDTCQQHVIPT